ncbi:MAG: ABC transporter permease [Chloroflexota bacterium]|nr:ABC transporter permease [Chloroflexota bacterium]
MNLALFVHHLRQSRLRLLAVVAGLTVWGALMPIIYATFGVTLRDIGRQFPALEQMMRFGGGNVFTLPGSIALGYIHPIAIALLAVFAIAFPLSAVAGERQRGTLEVVLSRPISRRAYYAAVLLSATFFVALAIAATLVGAGAAATLFDVGNELEYANLPALWLHGTMLYIAIAAISLAASVSFDRLAPAASVTLAIVLVSYFLHVLGSLWPDAEWLQRYSMFYYLDPETVLTEGTQPIDLAVLAVVAIIGIFYALIVFPRRDVGAPA